MYKDDDCYYIVKANSTLYQMVNTYFMFLPHVIDKSEIKMKRKNKY